MKYHKSIKLFDLLIIRINVSFHILNIKCYNNLIPFTVLLEIIE